MKKPIYVKTKHGTRRLICGCHVTSFIDATKDIEQEHEYPTQDEYYKCPVCHYHYWYYPKTKDLLALKKTDCYIKREDKI